jgi:hypothetical protein
MTTHAPFPTVAVAAAVTGRHGVLTSPRARSFAPDQPPMLCLLEKSFSVRQKLIHAPTIN